MAFLLVMTVFLPLIGSVVLFLLPEGSQGSARQVALGFALATLASTVLLCVGFDPGFSGPQFAFGGRGEPYGIAWMGGKIDTRFALGLDGISLGLFALTAILGVSAVCSSWDGFGRRSSTNLGLLLMLESALLGLFASLDIILFYIFFEFTLIPLFFLIGVFGGPERRRASLTFFLYTLAGSLLTLLGVIALVAIHHQHTPGRPLTFSIPELTQGLASLSWEPWQRPLAWADRGMGWEFWGSPQVLIFCLLAAGFCTKLAMFPLHTWQPLAYVEAPTGATILLAGSALKVGSYGLLRFNLGMTPLGAEALAPLMSALGVVAIIYGALAALAQHDLKRLIAYSSISHMGFVVIGLFSLNATGIEGATIQMINHGLTTGALFACVGVLADRFRTRQMAEMSGLWNVMPVWSFFIIVAALGSAALPGLNGFVGEFPILLGAYRQRPVIAIMATAGMILGAYYLLWMLQKVVFGPLREPAIHLDDSADRQVRSVPERPMFGWPEVGAIGPLVAMIFIIGLIPAPFIERIKPPLAPIVQRLDRVPEPVVARRSGPASVPSAPTVLAQPASH